MSEVKQFQTETKRLLNLMINSIYTNKEIFLRELIANASDAIDKHHYLSLTDDSLEKKNDYHIRLSFNKDDRTITICDNGIGMTYDEVVNHLGTIAKSGSKEFMENMKDKEISEEDEREIIGQFGVGFYSSYLVADKVEVRTRSPYSDTGIIFTSDGIENYSIDKCDKEEVGTCITLYLRKNDDDNDFDEFLNEYRIKSLVKKYSDYIRYPIMMECEKTEPVYDSDGKPTEETTITIVDETLNSMIPLWKKNKNDVTDEERNEFYKNKFYDYVDPLDCLQYSVEGNITYTALLYIPEKAPFDLYSENYEKGLQLYNKGVFVMDKCKELVPDYLRFMKGIVDSSDLSLNISREILQQTKDLEKIGSNLEKKVVRHLSDLQTDDPEKYNKFFETFGVNIKFGIYNNYGEKADLLKDLVMFRSYKENKLITLKDYVFNMKDGQDKIYFVSCDKETDVEKMPQMDLLKKKEYDVLILTDSVDEFVLQILRKYDDKEFKSINQGDLDLLTDDEKKELDKTQEEKSEFLGKIKESLGSLVKDVRISRRLVDAPVCLVSGDGISFEMEKVLNSMPGRDEKIHADRILEINPNHEIFGVLESITDPDVLKDYMEVLYNQALIQEGFTVDNPSEFISKMCKIMVKASK